MKLTCKEGKCSRGAVARGLCRKHYDRSRYSQGQGRKSRYQGRTVKRMMPPECSHDFTEGARYLDELAAKLRRASAQLLEIAAYTQKLSMWMSPQAHGGRHSPRMTVVGRNGGHE